MYGKTQLDHRAKEMAVETDVHVLLTIVPLAIGPDDHTMSTRAPKQKCLSVMLGADSAHPRFHLDTRDYWMPSASQTKHGPNE